MSVTWSNYFARGTSQQEFSPVQMFDRDLESTQCLNKRHFQFHREVITPSREFVVLDLLENNYDISRLNARLNGHKRKTGMIIIIIKYNQNQNDYHKIIIILS